MSEYFLLIFLFPIVFAFIVRNLKINEKRKEICNMIVVCITSIITLLLVILPPSNSLFLFKFNDTLKIVFKLDGIGRIFAGMVSILWPFAYLYTMGYMEGHDKKKNYAMFYVMTFGVVLGISFAASLISMYIFYELLTFVTYPLIIRPMTKEAKRATRFYLYISLFGSTLALVGIIILVTYFKTGDFINVFDNNPFSIYASNKNLAYIAYILLFLGFGVKAAVFPFHMWLPRAGVAPTPTTALLHAVAVVKAGAFAIIRTIYSVIGIEILSGSVVQIITMMMASFTIVFGSIMATKQLHLKRRYAYSTISNISYILLSATMMSEYGLYGAMLHMIFHSIAKISIFFICGAITKKTGATHIDYLNGMGKKMPVLFICYLIAGLSIVGLPGFAGFISKWEIASAAILVNKWYSLIGIVCLLISALLTAIYVINIGMRAFFMKPTFENKEMVERASEPNLKYMIPIMIFSILSFILGIFGTPLLDLIKSLLEGGLM